MFPCSFGLVALLTWFSITMAQGKEGVFEKHFLAFLILAVGSALGAQTICLITKAQSTCRYFFNQEIFSYLIDS